MAPTLRAFHPASTATPASWRDEIRYVAPREETDSLDLENIVDEDSEKLCPELATMV
jgi:hypothetical protein